jgi:hypothetical protein
MPQCGMRAAIIGMPVTGLNPLRGNDVACVKRVAPLASAGASPFAIRIQAASPSSKPSISPPLASVACPQKLRPSFMRCP